MDNTCLLAFDLGSSGLKATAVATDGQVLGSASAPYRTRLDKGGVAEQDPESWWQAVRQATKGLMERVPGLPQQVAAIGTSGHMIGCVPVDAGGAALRPAMTNADCRATTQCEFVDGQVGAGAMFRLTGNVLDARSSLCKALWVKDNEPELYAKTEKFLQSKDYLVARLTGVVDTTDFSDASHGQLIDIAKKDYDTALLAQLGLERKKFPTLRRSHQVVGPLTAAAAAQLGLKQGTPVVAGGGDGACASVAAGSVRPGEAYCCLGTTGWIACFSPVPVFDEEARLFNIMALDGEGYGVFGTTQAAGHAFDWVRGVLGELDIKTAGALAAEVPPGSDGLVFLPYLDGERSPIFDANARGVYFGLSSMHGRAHILRAALEGVAYALRSILEVQRGYAPIPSMRIIGGGASSALWRQIISDVCGAGLERISVSGKDATSVGAAIAAGVGAGVYKNYAEACAHIGVTGQESPHLYSTYEQGYALFQKLYPALRPLFPGNAEAPEE